MTSERTDKVRQAREQARRALGRSVDEEPLPIAVRKPAAGERPGVRWEPVGPALTVLTFADVARRLGIGEARVAALVSAGDLATVRVGDFGARMVPSAEVERIRQRIDSE